MNRRAFITLLGGAAAWPLSAHAQQRERMRRIGSLSAGAFFVAANGNDNGPGTQAQPWASIDRVNGAVLTPGTQVFFRGGDTFVGNLRPVINGGDPNNPVIIGSYGNGRAEFNPAVGGFGQGVVNLDNNGLTGITIQDLILRCPNNAIQPRGTIRIANNSALPTV